MSLTRERIGYGVYIALIILTGYLVHYLSESHRLFNNSGPVVWTSLFLLLTFAFKPTRNFLIPKITLKPFKQWQTYLYIVCGLLLPYSILKFSIVYEVFMDQNLINAFKYGYLKGADLNRIFNATIIAPIWEEIFFRGIILFSLSKFLKPVLAIVISSIIFAMFHPMYLLLTFVAGITLSVIAIKTKSLVPGMVIHSVWNLYTAKLFLYF